MLPSIIQLVGILYIISKTAREKAGITKKHKEDIKQSRPLHSNDLKAFILT